MTVGRAPGARGRGAADGAPPHAGLSAFGVECPQTGNRSLNLTQIHTRKINVASMSDTDLNTYIKLLGELKELLPSEKEPKALPGVVRR
jgi:hypothetical protein